MMEINTNNNSFDPTPKLKSSPIPINFISFNQNDDTCFCCGNVYEKTLCFYQKYCGNCFSQYSNDITDHNNICFDVDINMIGMISICEKHKTSSLISYFKCDIYDLADRDCKLCGKLMKLC